MHVVTAITVNILVTTMIVLTKSSLLGKYTRQQVTTVTILKLVISMITQLIMVIVTGTTTEVIYS